VACARKWEGPRHAAAAGTTRSDDSDNRNAIESISRNCASACAGVIDNRFVNAEVNGHEANAATGE
jgi:hypothetical protein